MGAYEQHEVAIDPAIACALYGLAAVVKAQGYHTFEPIIVNGEVEHVFVDGELYTVRPIVWDVLEEVDGKWQQ